MTITQVGSGGALVSIASDSSGDIPVNGYLVLKITDTDSSTEGALWYDASENKLKFYNGTAVQTITSA